MPPWPRAVARAQQQRSARLVPQAPRVQHPGDGLRSEVDAHRLQLGHGQPLVGLQEARIQELGVDAAQQRVQDVAHVQSADKVLGGGVDDGGGEDVVRRQLLREDDGGGWFVFVLPVKRSATGGCR